MASATASNMIQGQSLKSHFMRIWVLALLNSALISSKKCIIFEKLKDYSTNPSNWSYSGQGIADLNKKLLKKYQSSVSIWLTLKLA